MRNRGCERPPVGQPSPTPLQVRQTSRPRPLRARPPLSASRRPERRLLRLQVPLAQGVGARGPLARPARSPLQVGRPRLYSARHFPFALTQSFFLLPLSSPDQYKAPRPATIDAHKPTRDASHALVPGRQRRQAASHIHCESRAFVFFFVPSDLERKKNHVCQALRDRRARGARDPRGRAVPVWPRHLLRRRRM